MMRPRDGDQLSDRRPEDSLLFAAGKFRHTIVSFSERRTEWRG
jgi:hypothetical protein